MASAGLAPYISFTLIFSNGKISSFLSTDWIDLTSQEIRVSKGIVIKRKKRAEINCAELYSNPKINTCILEDRYNIPATVRSQLPIKITLLH